MLTTRSNGILCHISSLPSFYGIGDLGAQAFNFADLLIRAGQKWWQILPLNPTDHALGNAPYSSFSAFAFNILLISPDQLVKDGFCIQEDIDPLRLPVSGGVDYDRVYSTKAALVGMAFGRFQRKGIPLKAFEDFCREQAGWLDDFALFVVLKQKFAGAVWVDWPVECRDRYRGALDEILISEAENIRKEKFAQYLFYGQWSALKAHCSANGLGIIGDIPIYVNYDSADVWVHPGYFKLDADGKPAFVAGVPPDYFAGEGQRWGNPVYDWEALHSAGFSWWVERIRHNLELFDLVRVDHFRAFAQCWEIPAHERTAIKGVWRDVPGMELFLVLKKHFPILPIIAEDLGIITADVDALKDHFGFPGMRVVMFAFHNAYRKSRDLPENYLPNAVVYTGTHDNNTVRGWFEEDMTDQEKENFYDYFKVRPSGKNIHWRMIHMAMGSAANICIIPLQDLLGLGSEARMNQPSLVKGNWRWRFEAGALAPGILARLRRWTLIFQR